MKKLTRESILSNRELPRVEVAIPEWGGTVHIRTMTAGERDSFEESITENSGNIRARLAVATLCDEEGKPLFGEIDVPLLGSLSAKAVNRVFSVASKLNGVTKSDVEELEKNSQAALSGGTSSDSPDILDLPFES